MTMIQTVLDLGVNVTHVYVDTVGPPLAYQDKLKARFPTISFRVEKKADSLFPIVSAASICAKVTRDACLESWEYIENVICSKSFGSGYPSGILIPF